MVAAALLGVGVSKAPQAKAANLYWDSDATAAGNNISNGTGLGGTGTWDTPSLEWFNGTDNVAWSNSALDFAYFTGTAGTVTLGGPITIGGLVFAGADYTLTGGTLTLAAATGAPEIAVTNGNVATLASVIAGTSGLTKTGEGTLRLTQAANTYAGTTTIAGGLLIISDASQLGTDASAIVVTAGNNTPSNTALIGFAGGSLVLDGLGASIDLARPLNLEGRGPIGNNGAALFSVGNNTLSGLVTASVSSQTPATFRNTRLTSSNGVLTLSGGLVVQGTAGTTFTTLGGVNQGGVANYNLTGALTGTGTLQKTGGGTLNLSPSDASGFSGRVRISGSAANGQSSVRVTSAAAFGTANGGTTNATIDIDGGTLEAYTDTTINFAKNVYGRAGSRFFVSNAIGGFAVNGGVAYGNFSFEDNQTFTFASRNGFGASFTTAPVNGGDANNTFTNDQAGLLAFSGNFWSNTDSGAARTFTFGGNGNTLIDGNVIASGGASFDHALSKTGSGLLTITGTGTTLDGAVSVQGGLAITDFRSLNNNTSAGIHLGSGGTAGALIIGTGVTPTAGGLTTSKPINLASTTGGVSIYANQAGTNPVIFNGEFSTTAGGATESKTLTLGGTNTADNVINTSLENQASATTGTLALSKIGAGTWVLAGVNTFSGGTTITDGVLKLRANAATSTILPSAHAITFNANNVFAGGTLELVGQASVNNVQSLGALTPTQGANTIRVTPGAGGNASLTFASLGTIGDGATVNIVGSNGSSSVVTLTGVATGLVAPHFHFSGDHFAYSASAVLRAPVYGTDSGFVTAPAATALPAGQSHFDVTGDITAQASQTVGTLRLAGARTVTLASGATLTVRTGAANTDGGLLATGGASVITGGTGISTGGSGALIVRVNELADSLTLASVLTNGTTGGLTKSGAGTLILSGNNAQTGTISINQGTIQLSGSGRLGAANTAVTIRQRAVLDLNGVSTGTAIGNFNSNGQVINSSASAVTLTVGNNNGTGTSYGVISQTAGVINVTKIGTGAQSWLGLSNYTGVTTIGSSGLVTVDSLTDGGVPSGIGAASSDAANLVFNGTSGGIVYRGDLVNGILSLGSTSASTDRLFTLAGTGATLSSSATTNINNAVVWRNTGAIAHGIVGPQTLTFTGSSQGDNRFNPQLTDSGTVANVTSVTKTGTGIWHLGAAASTYSGPTLINQGILGATNSQGLSPNSNLQFDGGTLYSQGVFARDIGTGAGQMRFLAAAANTAQFSGGFLGGDAKLTVTWTGTPVWGSTPGFLDARDGLILNGSQARAQGATGSIALSEVEIAGSFSLGASAVTGGSALAFTLAQNSSTVSGLASTAGLVVGQSFTGTNVPSGAYITSINSASAINISANTANTGGIAGSYTDGAFIVAQLRPIRVDDNGNTGADFATISGVISAADTVTGLRKLGTGTLRLTGLNTYQGETNVNQGALVVRSLGSSLSAASTPTSVGLSGSNITFGNANAVTIGNGGTGGAILQYAGPGETTDRKIRINTTTGGAQLHADGSGAWVLTNFANDMAAGAKTLNLRGTNAGANLITSQLSDNGGALAITVDGGAAWVLTNGTNNYTGLTLVSAGALGIGHNTAIGGAIQNNNGNIFAYGADRSVANVLTLNNNTQWGFTGSYSLAFTSPVVLATSANSNNVYNSIVAGKALTFASMTANALTANRNFGVDGPGETIIAGNITTSTAFGLQIIKTGDGTLTLGGDGTVSNWNQTGTGLDLDRGVLKFSANNVINTSAGTFAGITVTPELADGDVATIDLNGTTQTVNGLTASANGTLRVDNTSASAGSFRFGANNAAVAFGTGVGTYVIQNTGAGALGLVKLGSSAVTFGTGVAVGNKGELASEGGSFTIAGQVTAASGLRAVGASTLALTGGITNPGLMRSIEVGAGSTLTLLDGAGSNFNGLTALRLGNTGTGTAILNLNVGTGATDTLSLAAGGTLALGASVTFNLTDAGLDENTAYTLLNLADGGITAFGAANMVQGAMPGGFDAITWSVDNNQVSIITGNLITGTLYWRGLTNSAWNGNANNWSTDKAGSLASTSFPGAGTDVVFSHNGATGALVTTLEQNYRVNSLTFEPGTTTSTSVTINTGANASSRLEVSDFITLAAGAPATVTLGGAYKIGGAQTWTVADAAATLTFGGVILGNADVTKAGAGKVVLAAAADATFNTSQGFDLIVNAGAFEIQNVASLGTLANANVANVTLNGGAFYLANATAGSVPTPLTLNGGALSASLANHTYGGAVAVTAASTINMADANGPATNAARSITLSGPLSGTGSLTVDSNNDPGTGGNQLTGTLTINNAGGSWSGDLLFNRGTVSVEAAASATVAPANIIFNSFGRYIVKGVDGQTINRAGALTLAAAAVGEFQVDNTTGTQVTDFVVNQNGAVTLGAGSALRAALPDQLARLNLAGAVTLAGNASISVSNNAARILTISGAIGETGGARTLTVNDDLGGWGQTNGIVRLTGANTFTGSLTVTDGVVEFGTMSNIGGGASNLGQGSALSLSGGILRFVGDASQTTNRTIAAGNATISANGASGATATFAGAITQTLDTSLTLVGAAGAEGFLAGGIAQTGAASDLYVNSGVWTLSGTASVLADDIVVTGSAAVLNLGATSVASFTSGTSNGLYARSGATINLLASDVFGPLNSGSLDFIILADNASGVAAGRGILNLNAFNLETPRLDLGQRASGFDGQVDGTGTLLVRGGAIDLFRGAINANLASDGTSTLEKFSLGTVVFKGDNSGLTSTGANIFYEGTVVLDYTVSNTPKLRAASQLEMRGANLTLIGNAGAASSQSVGSFTLGNGGSAVISLNAGAGQGLVLNLNAITRAINSQDGTLRVVLPTGTQGAANGVTTDTLNTLGSGENAILGGWLTVDDGSGVFFGRNAAGAADGNIVAAVTATKDQVSTWVLGENASDAAGFTGTLAAAYPNSLRFNAAAGSDLVLGGAGVLGIGSGGVLVTANVGGTPGIANGTLFSGATASNVAELIFIQDSAQPFEVSADILGSQSLTKAGNGVLVLAGQNRYTGTTEVQGGVLRVVGGNAIGDTSLVNLTDRRASTVQLLSSETIGRLGGGSRQTEQDLGLMDIGVHTLTFNQTSGTTYSGMLAGSGTIVMSAVSNSNFNYNGQSSTTTFTGSVLVNGGLFQLSGSTARLGGATAFTINGRGTFLLDNNDDSAPNDRIADTASFTVNSAAGAWGGTTIARGLSIRSDNNGNESETIGALTFASGANYASLEASSGSSAFTAYIADSWVRQNNATFNVRGRTLGATSDANGRSQFKVADANDAALISANIGGGGTIGGTAKNVSIFPWAIGETISAGLTDANMGNTFVSYVDNRGLVPLSLAGEFSTFATAATGHNVRESLLADLGSLASLSANSLIIHNNSTAASTLAVAGAGAGATLGLASGAMMFTLNPSAAASSVHAVSLGGFNDGITAGSSGEYVIHVVNPSSAANTPVLTATVSSPLTSAADITKSGRGVLVLSGANTAGGAARRTTINEGVLQIGDLDNIGGNTGALIFAGGALRLGAGFADDLSQRTISFLSGGGSIDTNGVDLVLAGSLGAGAGGFTKLGTGNLTLNAAASFTGGATLSAGTITLGANDALGVGGSLTINAGASLDIGSRSLTVSTLTTAGASPVITGTGVITASQGFSFGQTTDLAVAAVLAGPLGLSKSQSSVLTLSGANTYAGTTEVTAGTLVFDSIANVGGGASSLGAPTNAENGVIRMGLTTNGAGLRYTGSGHSTDRAIGLQGTTGTISVFANGTGALSLTSGARFEMAGNKTFTLRGTSDAALANSIGALTELGGVMTLNKADANTWVLASANAYTGATQVDDGTIRLGVSDALPVTTALRLGTGATAGTLDLNGFNQTVGSLTVQTNNNLVNNSILVASGRSLTINGAVTIGVNVNESDTNFSVTGGGSLVVNSNNGNFQVGAATVDNENRVDVDFSGLASFTANLGSGVFRLGDLNTGTGNSTSTLRLAQTSTITAATLRIGDGTGGSQVHVLTLGNVNNVFNADTLNVGSAGSAIRSSGSIVFDPSDVTGMLKLRAANGIGRATLNLVNTSGNTAGDISGSMILAGHWADLFVGTLTMGARSVGTGAATGTLTFDQGTLDVSALVIASRTGAGTGNGSATLSIGGGSVDIGSVNMAVNTSAGGTVSAVFNVAGGSVSLGTGTGTALNMANAGSGRSATASLSITGGTLSLAGNIIRSGGAGTESATITLNGGIMNVNGFAIGEASKEITFTAQSGTLRNIGALNGTGGLTKTGVDTLILDGTAAYVGITTISAGTLQVGAGGTTGALGAGAIVNNGTLAISRSDAFAIGVGISGSGGLTKLAAGNLTLSGANNYTGATLVSAGSLTATSGALSATSGITVNGALFSAVNYNLAATLALDASATATISAADLNIAGAVTNAGTAAAALNFTASTGTIILASLAGSGRTRFGSDADITAGVSEGNITVVGALGANITGGTVTAGSIAGNVSAGTVSAGSLTGNITGGTVTVTGALTGNVTGGTVTAGSMIGNVSSSVTVTGQLTGEITAGTNVLGSLSSASVTGGTNTITGAANVTTINGGTTTVTGVATITTLTSGTLILNGATSSIGTLTDGTITLGNTTVLTVNEGTFAGTLGGGGSLIKASSGTLTINGANTFAGGTTINAGSLTILDVGSLGSGPVSVAVGATLNLGSFGITNVITRQTDGTSFGTVTGGVPITSVSPSAPAVVNTVLTGAEDLTRTGGELTLTTANFYTGATAVTGETAVIKAAFLDDTSSSLGVSTLSDPDNLVLGSGATLEFTGSTNTVTTRSFTIGGSATIAASGTGSLVFTTESKFATTGAEPALSLSAGAGLVNRFASGLADGSNPLANLAVDGAGTWILGGSANRFKNDVRIDAGAGATIGLESGALPSGAVIEVANGAKIRWESGNTNDFSSNLTVAANAVAKLDLGNNTVTFAAAPTMGAGASLQKEGAGTLRIAAAVSAPNLNVAVSTGTLSVNGTLGNIALGSGATLGGSGTLGAVTASTGSTIAPGNSPGIMTAASMTLVGNTTFLWEVQDAQAGPGPGGYDKLVISGSLDLTGADANNKITLKINSLTADGVTLGAALNFGAPNGVSSIRTFEFASVQAGASGVLLNSGLNISDVFQFDLTDFTYTGGGASNAALWSIDWNQTNGASTLTAVPEPSTYGFGRGALALAAAAIRRRRRQATKAE